MSDELKATSERVFEIHVTEETYQDICSLIQERGWDEAEGLRILLAAGIGYLRVTRFSDEEAVGMPQNTRDLFERLVKAESLLASMRFRMFELQQQNQNWELSNGAVFQENIGLRNLTNRHLEEISELRTRVSSLEKELTDLRKAVPAPLPAVGEGLLDEKKPNGKNWLKKVLGM